MKRSCDSPFTMDEIEVANIMLELPHLIFESESTCLRFSLTWGTKRKRSAASKEEVAATSSPALKLSPSSLPPLPSFVVGSTYETEGPIEKKKEQFLEMVEDFTQRNELLKRDIENKRRFLDQQITENLELKSKKQKLSQSLLTPEELRSETSKSLNLEPRLTKTSKETKNTTASSSQDYHHEQQRISTRVYQQAFIMDWMVCKSEMNKNSQYPFGRMISWLASDTGGSSKVHDNVGPLGLIDLNVSAEEAFGFSASKWIDLETATKARAAAQARLKRKQICKAKNFNAACKAR